MRGRKPTPTRLKVITGNPGKRRLRAREPKPQLAIPTCPAHLSPTAKAEWKRLALELYQLGILTHLDRAALAAYAQAYGRWVEAERKLKDTPTLLKLPNGTVQANPWLGIATKQLELMHRFASELGLSPVARTRVEARPPKAPSKFDGLLGAPTADDYLSGRYRA
jgi:P27 family predicted phage terminase small subunit